MKHQPVEITRGAARDLQAIYDFVCDSDSVRQADALLAKLDTLVANLGANPNRGSHPKELAGLGIRDYRQVIQKPYRIIYRVMNGSVIVFLVADRRRDMATLLAQRLLSSS